MRFLCIYIIELLATINSLLIYLTYIIDAETLITY